MKRYICLLLLSIGLANYGQAQTATHTLSNLLPHQQKILLQYTASNTWGYILGHNYKFNQQYAEKYIISGNAKVLGVISQHGGHYAHADTTAVFRVYSVGTNRLPAAKLGGKKVRYADLHLNGTATTTMFNAPIAVADSFFVSFDLRDYAHGGYEGDLIGLYCGENGTRLSSDLKNFGRNAVQAHEHDYDKWLDFRTQNFTNIATHFALFPIVEMTVTSIGKAFAEKEQLRLYPLSPNPTQDMSTVKYSLKGPSKVTLELLDFTGKRLFSQELGTQKPGEHTHTLPVAGLAPGSYIFSVQADAIRLATKLIIL